MSVESEIRDAIAILRKHNAPFILLHCNSTYPAPFKDINLRYLDRLKALSGSLVGYSGHERGYAVAVAAVAKGAKLIEKHFTIDRDMEGNDHRVSLLPDEFAQMVTAIREVEEAMGSAAERRLTQGELMNREVLAKSLVAAVPIAKGEIITEAMIETRSPGQGLQPYHRPKLVGRIAEHDFEAGDFFYPTDIEPVAYKARPFSFRRPYGIPVRYHDLGKLAGAANLDLVEFHLSYKDMEEAVEDHLGDKVFDLDLVVHSPELFAGDHIMDLCAPDPAYRQRSIEELRKVVELTRRLTPHFAKANRPMIIINAGGFSMDGPIDPSARAEMYALIAASLAEVDQGRRRDHPADHAAFPLAFGGQRYHNLF
jgi:N-acetylneuraminate synthase